MAFVRAKRRLQSAMVNVLFCYGVFVMTCLVAWAYVHQTQKHKATILPVDVDNSRGRLAPPVLSMVSKIKTGDAQKQLVPLRISKKNTPERTGNRTKHEARNQTNNLLQREIKQPQVKKCASLTEYSKWFRSRYKPNIKLFLDKDDTKNVRSFSSQLLPFGFKSQNINVVSQVLQHKDFTNPPVHGAGGKKGCIRCAVVGSGGILNGSGAGEEIDGHNYIFRLNKAASSSGNFAKDVGKRTTFYTFYPESQYLSNTKDENVLALYTMFKSFDVKYALNILRRNNSTVYLPNGPKNGIRGSDINPRKLKLVHPGFFYYVCHDFMTNRARPTTGALVIFLAIHICDEVTVYGFGYDPRFSVHYYDKEFVKHRIALTATHNVVNERKLWLKLHDEGVIRLFQRDL